jgi:hypothetical protein
MIISLSVLVPRSLIRILRQSLCVLIEASTHLHMHDLNSYTSPARVAIVEPNLHYTSLYLCFSVLVPSKSIWSEPTAHAILLGSTASYYQAILSASYIASKRK